MLTDTEVADPILGGLAEQLDKDLDEALEEWASYYERHRQASMQTVEIWKRLTDAGLYITGSVKYGQVEVKKSDLSRLRAILGCPLKLKDKSPSYMEKGMVQVALTPLAYPDAEIRYLYAPSETDRCQLKTVHYADVRLVCKT